MKRSVWLFELFGFAVTSLGGTLLHFLYDWLGESLWIAPFSGVNESTWEHMKLLFWPMLIFAFVQSLFFKDHNAYWCIKARGILIGLLLIPVIFYTYNGAIGRSPDWINITIFFIAAAAVYLYEARALYKNSITCHNPQISIAILYTVAAMFVIFTFSTPHIGIFRDPLTGNFGI